MSKLNGLRNAKNLTDFAYVLGYQPKALSYILYKIPEDNKYTTFEIPKKSGGVREIHAPMDMLKVLQKRLSDILYECIEETLPASEKDHSKSKRMRSALSHGFKKGLSIASNAALHENRRYVLNLDLQDFFPSFNFGRVRGYFIKNQNFKLDPAVATIIAQIACHKNILPQGSPCSPVISNLVGQILDVRLTRLAKKYKCTYSRYADDITFSTNLKEFPSDIAFKKSANKTDWLLGEKLSKCIENTGFQINHSKTRMQYKDSRQVVTGLIVNKTVNTKKEYYRYARSMCNALFRTGSFHLPEISPIPSEPETKRKDFFKLFLNPLEAIRHSIKNAEPVAAISEETKETGSLNQLEGVLNFIYEIKKYRNKFADKGYRESRADNKKKYPPADRCNQYSDESHQTSIDGIKNLYSKFLFFKHFYFLDQPLIWCEGKTDKVYLKCALRQLAKDYPELISIDEKETKFHIKFFNHTRVIHEVMNLAEGTSGMKYMTDAYNRLISRYKCEGKKFPVIMLIDNDDGAKGIFKVLGQRDESLKDPKSGKVIKTKQFYRVSENLYIVPTPIKDNDSQSKIEDLFDQKTLSTELDGKTFNPENGSSVVNNQYGKTVFAEKVIKQNQDKINFTEFKKILSPISNVIMDYNKQANK